ncbi:hypothetical protein Tsubulata_034181 [Turnera subulata]|uniref:Uncharacterized protein n=1 Tax=Turnera subulata TaxID=218843 RepID=A0A9Q0GH30_9ROSI|nr:hypothetical protein Tsubulata_034181 [Turnera subulata]
MEVKILSQKLVKPSTPTSHQLLKISYLDQIAPPAYLPFIFYYQADAKPIPAEQDERCNQLERSLSETLSLYYPLAGRYNQDKLMVDCNDEGAFFVEAKADGNLDQLLQGKPEGNVLNRLLPFEDEMSFRTILLAVQINRFDCGGLAIGMCLSHKIADGSTASSFINAWATASRVGINEVTSPGFDAGSLFPSTEALTYVPAPPSISNDTKIVTKRFVFGGDAIFKLKARAMEHTCYSDSKNLPSRVQVVTAMIWKALMGINQAKHNQLRTSLLVSSYNLRDKMALPVPQSSFGNLYRMVVTRFQPTHKNPEFQELVTLFNHSVTKAKEDTAKIANPGDMVALASNSSREVGEEVKSGGVDVCIISSLSRFPFYDADFGWGKPHWFSSVHKPLEIGLLLDTKCGTGIEAWMSLEEKRMLQFEQDQDIVAFTSSGKQSIIQAS